MSDKMERLAAAREKVEAAIKRKTRLEGQADGHKNRLGEVEAKCRKEYDCEIDELPELVERLEEEAEEALRKAEELLKV